MDDRDTDCAALLDMLRALVAIEFQTVVAAIAPTHWAQLPIRAVGGELLTVTAEER
ncbi:hypothetical protein [Nocardiopsis synnemataformans]|uniref:hypothetical protein n=1 Tax=Nocardiopsis synnemataformans TaxID=61305 RepID=UPI003EBCD446